MLFLRCLGIEAKGDWGGVGAELEKKPPEVDIKCNSEVKCRNWYIYIYILCLLFFGCSNVGYS